MLLTIKIPAKFSRMLLAASIAFASNIEAAPWEGARLSENQLSEIETPGYARNKNSIGAKSLRVLASSSFVYSYIDAYKIQLSKLPTVPGVNRQNKETNPVYPILATDGLVNGTHTFRHSALWGLAVGLDIYSFFATDRTEEEMANLQKNELPLYKRPSLWLIKIEHTAGPIENPGYETYAAEVRKQFDAAQSLMLSFPLECDPTYYRTSTMFGKRGNWGRYLPPTEHIRAYLCGHTDLDVPASVAENDSISLAAQRTNDNYWVSRIAFPGLDQNNGIRQLLNLPAEQENNIAAELYKKLSPLLDEAWHAVFTAPNDKGDWAVYVAKSGSIMEFPRPPDGKR